MNTSMAKLTQYLSMYVNMQQYDNNLLEVYWFDFQVQVLVFMAFSQLLNFI